MWYINQLFIAGCPVKVEKHWKELFITRHIYKKKFRCCHISKSDKRKSSKSPDDHQYHRDENFFYQASMSTSISIINNKSFFDLERVVSFSDKILQWFKHLVHKIERDALISRDQWMMEHQQRRFFVLADMTIRSNDKEKKNSSDDQWKKFTRSTALSLNLQLHLSIVESVLIVEEEMTEENVLKHLNYRYYCSSWIISVRSCEDGGVFSCWLFNSFVEEENFIRGKNLDSTMMK